MLCRTVEEKLSRYLAGECSEEEKLALQSHLTACPDCAALSEEMRRLDQLLDTWAPERAPAELWSTVMAEVDRMNVHPQAAVGSRRSALDRNRLGTLLRDLLVAAAVSLIFFWNTADWFNGGQMASTGKSVGSVVSAYTRITGSILEKATGSTGEYTRMIFFEEWRQK